MRPLLLLPILFLPTSCALFKKGEKAPKPKFTIFEAAAGLQSNSPPPVRVGVQDGDRPPSAATPLPSPGTPAGYQLPDVMSKMPEDRELRGGTGGTPNSSGNTGVIAKPPKE